MGVFFLPSLSLEIFVMIFKRKILPILVFLMLFSQSSFSQDQNVLDILDAIQKDLKTLEKAVYSDSASLNSNTTSELKEKYGIISSKVVIYCARFIKDRRPDLLIKLIEKMKEEDIKFFIIGDGPFKPDFSIYQNVRDFGALYDEKIKAELFSMADFSFQPAWTGLSVVESFAHGVPYITLKKSESIYQCVEYSYIIHGFNGIIAQDLSEAQDLLTNTNDELLKKMKNNSITFVDKNLTLKGMVDKFVNNIRYL